MSIEWMKAQAEKAMRDQVERAIATSRYPDGSLAHGMLEGFYMVDLSQHHVSLLERSA